MLIILFSSLRVNGYSCLLNYQVHSGQLSTYAVAPLSGKQAKSGTAIIEEESWAEYKIEIQEIKDAGKSKALKREVEPV